MNLGIVFGVLITSGPILIFYLSLGIKKKFSEYNSHKRTGDTISYEDAVNGSAEAEHTYEEIRFWTALFPKKYCKSIKCDGLGISGTGILATSH